MFQSKESRVESGSGNIFGVPLHPRAVGAPGFGREAGRGRQIKGSPAGPCPYGNMYLLPPKLCIGRVQPGEVPQPLLSFRISVLPL